MAKEFVKFRKGKSRIENTKNRWKLALYSFLVLQITAQQRGYIRKSERVTRHEYFLTFFLDVNKSKKNFSSSKVILRNVQKYFLIIPILDFFYQTFNKNKHFRESLAWSCMNQAKLNDFIHIQNRDIGAWLWKIKEIYFWRGKDDRDWTGWFRVIYKSTFYIRNFSYKL